MMIQQFIISYLCNYKVRKANKKRREKNIKTNNYLYKKGYISYSSYFNSMNNYSNCYKYDKYMFR